MILTFDFVFKTLQAYEVGNPDFQFAYCILDIAVKDIDDHDPIFDPESYEVQLQEHSPGGTFVVQIKAFDKDEV